MKKILTLMAAMSAVAGPAMAADYVWNVDATGNITTDVKGDIAFANNQFTFTVNSGEKVWVKGSNVTVKFNGVELAGTEQIFDMEGTGLIYTPTGAGQVVVSLGNSSSIEKIKVVGSESWKVEKKFEEVQETLANASKETAQWAGTEFDGFFSAVRAQFNTQGAEAQKLRAELEKLQKANNVNSMSQKLINKLDNAKNAINDMLALAKQKKATYDNIVGTDAAGLKATLDKGESKPAKSEVTPSNNVKNGLVYIQDWKWENGQVKPAGYKTTWIKGEWNDFTSNTTEGKPSIATIKTEALAELEKFPNSFAIGFERTDFQAQYAELKQGARNVIARANFERDYKKGIEDLNMQMNTIESIADAKAPFDLSKISADYMSTRETIGNLVVLVQSEADRRGADADMFKDIVNDQYNPAKAVVDEVIDALKQQAIDALNKHIDNTQNELSEKANKISAKYVNEPNTQKEYEQKFALIQQNLDKQKATANNKSTYAKDVVKGYKDCEDAIKGIDNEINSLWSSTLSAQKKEVLDNNHKEAVKLLGNVEKVREAYNTNVLRIKKWVDASWTDNDTKVKLNANLKELFGVAGGVDKMKEDIVADTLRYTKLINETPDIEFNANDNQYRLLQGKDQVVKFTENLTNVETAIMKQIKEAVFTANLCAANYLNGSPMSNAYWYVADAQEAGHEDANLWPGTKHEFMSAEAVALFQKEFEKIAYKDANKQGAGYLDEAERIIAAGHVTDSAKVDIDKQKLADQVADVVAIFDKVKPAVDALNKEKVAYKNLYAAIYVQKIDWNVVKAEAATYQKAIDAAAKEYNTTGFDVTARLKELNKLFDGVKDVDGCTEDGAYTTLEKGTNPVNAKDAELNASINKKIEDFKAGLNEIRKYPEILKNKAAMTTADADIKAVEAELVNAREAIKAYNETVQAGATQLLNGAESALKTAKAAIEDASNKLELADNYTEGQNLKQGLTNASQEIKDALAWAAQAAKDADLDYNGDGKVNVQDLVDADADFQKTGDGFTFYKFLDAYLEYLSK